MQPSPCSRRGSVPSVPPGHRGVPLGDPPVLRAGHRGAARLHRGAPHPRAPHPGLSKRPPSNNLSPASRPTASSPPGSHSELGATARLLTPGAPPGPAPPSSSASSSGLAGHSHLAGTTPDSTAAPPTPRHKRSGARSRQDGPPAPGSGSPGRHRPPGTGHLRGWVGSEEVHGEAEVAALGARVDGRALHVQVEGAARSQRAAQQQQQPQPRHSPTRSSARGGARPRGSGKGAEGPHVSRGGAGSGITSSRPAPSSLFSSGQGRQEGEAASCGAGGGPCSAPARAAAPLPARLSLPPGRRARPGPAHGCERPSPLRAAAAGQFQLRGRYLPRGLLLV